MESLFSILAIIVLTFSIGMSGTTTPDLTVARKSNDVIESHEVYVNESHSISFSIPSGWEKQDFMKERAFLKTKYAKDLYIFTYGESDFWNQLPSELTAGYSRKSLDFSHLTKEQMLELFLELFEDDDYVVEDLSVEDYAGHHFVHAKLNSNSTYNGISVDFIIDEYMTIENGIYYQFMASGDDSFMTELEFLLNSIRFN